MHKSFITRATAEAYWNIFSLLKRLIIHLFCTRVEHIYIRNTFSVINNHRIAHLYRKQKKNHAKKDEPSEEKAFCFIIMRIDSGKNK